MRGRIVRFAYLARRRQRAQPLKPESNLPRKPWIFRLLDKTAAPFWFARVKRRMRHIYRNWVVFRFYAGSRMTYRIDVRGLENFNYDPSTIIACGHKRDMDIPAVISTFFIFCKAGSRLKHLRQFYVATRDDVFEDGFLTVYFPVFNRLRPLIARLSVKRIFDLLQACPVKLPDEQTVNQLLNETRRIEGDLPLEEALDMEWQKRFLGDEAGKPGLTIKDVILRAPLPALAEYATPRMFREPLATRIRQRHAATMVQQLRYITRILEKGGTLFVLPQGQVTPDGRFSKMRAAVTRLVLQTRVETKLLPVNITYDYMDTARPSATLLIGPEVAGLKHHNKTELAEIIREKVASLSCVTVSGLASRWLVGAANQDQPQVNLRRMRQEIWEEARRLGQLGLPLDCQLATRPEFDRRFDRFLKYIRLNGGVFATAEERQAASAEWANLDLAALRREECRNHNDNPVRYCYNELTELMEIWDALPEAEAAAKNNITSIEEGAKRVRRHRTAG